MKSLYQFIVEPKGNRYNNTKKIGDKSLLLNTSIESFRHINKEAVVVSTPAAFNTEINVGDIVFENASDSVAMISANRASANDAADMLFYTQVASGSNAEKMRIKSDGDVGIGTTAPNS